MTKHKPNPSAFANELLTLICAYGDHRALIISATDDAKRTTHAIAALRMLEDIGAAVRSGTLPTPGLDDRLDVAFAAAMAGRPTQDDHTADYGIDPGPTAPTDGRCLTAVGTGATCERCGGPASGVHSNHTLTEDAAAATAAAQDDEDLAARTDAAALTSDASGVPAEPDPTYDDVTDAAGAEVAS